MHPDLARADEADGLAVQIEAEQAVEQKVALAHAVVRLVVLAHDGEDHPDCELGDGLGRVGGHAHDGEPVRAGGGEVDVVEP